jgi:hypothetical protein
MSVSPRNFPEWLWVDGQTTQFSIHARERDLSFIDLLLLLLVVGPKERSRPLLGQDNHYNASSQALFFFLPMPQTRAKRRAEGQELPQDPTPPKRQTIGQALLEERQQGIETLEESNDKLAAYKPFQVYEKEQVIADLQLEPVDDPEVFRGVLYTKGELVDWFVLDSATPRASQ